MGQKVHPLGFRVGITKKHQSQWFARFNKHKYSQSVLEDRLIRDTLSKLFPELINPVGVGAKKRDQAEQSITPRITQIKIERGFIPYEIGIQIHAENCELLKSAIDNLKVKRDLIVKLQKTRRYLFNLKLKLKDLASTGNSNNNNNNWVPYFQGKTQASLTIPTLQDSTASLKIKTFGKTERSSKKVSLRSSILGSFGKSKLLNNKDKEKKGFKFLPSTKWRGGLRSPKLTKQELKRQRLIRKRLKKRQSIRKRYRQLILKGLFLKKKAFSILTAPLTKIVQKLSFNKKFNNGAELSSQKRTTLRTTKQAPLIRDANKNVAKLATAKNSLFNSTFGDFKPFKEPGGSGFFVPKYRTPTEEQPSFNLGQKNTTFSSRIKKKFVTLFIQKMNKKFLAHLKVLLITPFFNNNNKSPNENKPSGFFEGSVANQPLTSSCFPTEAKNLSLGYNKKWEFNNRVGTLKNQPISKLNRMIVVLEQKLLIKLEALRKEFIAFGSISGRSTHTMGYFQILNFLKNLKELVTKLKREQKLQQSISKSITGSDAKEKTLRVLQTTVSLIRSNKLKVSSYSSLKENQRSLVLVYKKLNNIENECRKVKFIEYLKDIVKKHRTDNIYFYLSTLADARKDLRKIKQFTKRHANFLFGLNLLEQKNFVLDKKDPSKNPEGLLKKGAIMKEKISERVNKILEKTAKKTDYGQYIGVNFKAIKNREAIIEQIEKQRNMCLQNLKLTPKISIKFYSVNKNTLDQKASIVAESIVDALEKRKAFRKVIKDAKETLMRTPTVRGVKIIVSGRLNGAEIARTEWVSAGKVPTQTLKANLDYAYKTASTIYGIIGVKIYIFKGYTKFIN